MDGGIIYLDTEAVNCFDDTWIGAGTPQARCAPIVWLLLKHKKVLANPWNQNTAGRVGDIAIKGNYSRTLARRDEKASSGQNRF
jgi:hypothetical protein